MKKIVLKISIVAFVWGILLSSCSKKETYESSYTAENEALIISTWKNKMKQEKVAFDSTASKIYFIMDTTKIGTGSRVVSGNTVTVKYTGSYLDGTLFDFSDNYTYVHKAAGSRMISGWEEAIELLNKGSRGAFLIPSSLGYGPYGYYAIPPYCPLFFTIEVVDIK
jgi:FKBP-type peptidyl-prolyl cis-trans isomerases 1